MARFSTTRPESQMSKQTANLNAKRNSLRLELLQERQLHLEMLTMQK